MDGNVFGLVLLLLLLGGNGVDSFVRHRQRNTDREADKARWAALEIGRASCRERV